MQLNRATTLVAGAIAFSVVGCGPAQRGISPGSAPVSTPPSGSVETAVTSEAPHITDAGNPSVGPDPAAVLGVALRSLEAGEVRTRIPLPTNPIPFADQASIGAAADSTWRTWNILWYWASKGIDVLPDGTKSGVDIGVMVDVHLPPPEFDARVNRHVELFQRGTWRFLADQNACDPANPPSPESIEGWIPITSVTIVENEAVVATITVLDSVIPCPIPGRTVTPAELVDILAGLADCQVGGGLPTVCQALPPITDDDRARAIDLLSQWNLGHPDG